MSEWHAACTLCCKVPQSFVQEGEQQLCKLLNNLLKGLLEDVTPLELQQWKDLKRKHDDNIRGCLELVDQSALKLGQRKGEGGYGVVHEAEWPGKRKDKVAVKSPICGMGIVDIANLYKEALIQAALHDRHVVELFAATTTGWLVMELADTDLKTCSGAKLDWPCKLGLILQAALGLKFMHSQSPVLVHSDVKTANFLVFGEEPESSLVKISGFEETHRQKGSKSVRLGGGTPHNIAPESYYGQRLTIVSDVFSFGVVMYEIVTGRTPYEVSPYGNVELCIMSKKLGKEEPCEVREEDNCPADMLELMKDCCQLEATLRPGMQEVCQRLERLQESYGGDNDRLSQEPKENPKALDSPVSVLTEITFDEADYQAVKDDPKSAASFQNRIVRLIRSVVKRWLGFDIVAHCMDPRQGSAIFPIQFDFPSADAAQLFKQDIAPNASSIFQGDLELLAVKPRPQIVILEEWQTADAQAAELEDQLRQTMRDIGEVSNILYNHQVAHHLQRKLCCLQQSTFNFPVCDTEEKCRSWRRDAAALLHELKLALQMLRQHNILDIGHLCRTADAAVTVKQTLAAVRYFAMEWNLYIPGDDHCEDKEKVYK